MSLLTVPIGRDAPREVHAIIEIPKGSSNKYEFDLGMNTSTSNPYIKVKPPVKLWDGGAAHPIFSSMATVNVGGVHQYIFFGTGSDLLPSNGVSQAYKLVGVLDNGGTGTVTFNPILLKVDGSGDDEYPAKT